MATGKTHPRHFRLYADGMDLSGDTRGVSSFGMTYQEDAVTGWSEGVENYTLGQLSIFINGYSAVFNNATGRSFTELKDNESYVVCLPMGIRAAPAYGDPAFAATLQARGITVTGDGPVTLETDFLGVDAAVTTLPTNAFGVVQYPLTAITATTTGTQVDHGAATTNGCIGYLQVTATSSGNYAIIIEHSDTGAWGGEEATLLTFAANASAVGGEALAATGTVNKYTRIVATRTGGTCSIGCVLVRL